MVDDAFRMTARDPSVRQNGEKKDGAFRKYRQISEKMGNSPSLLMEISMKYWINYRSI